MQNSPGIVTPQISEYVKTFGLREPQILAELREETVKRQKGFLLMPETGQALTFLYKLIGAKRSLDVGCFTGYSALTAALAMGQDSEVISLDINEEWTQLAREFWKKANVDKQITLKLKPALESLDELINNGRSGQFDAAFIDADKSNYSAYVERCYTLVRQGGLIALDNTLWKGTVADSNPSDRTAGLFRELTANLQKDERFDFALLTIGDGITVLRKR